MSQMNISRITRAALTALFVAILMSCARPDPPATESKSAGRGAPVNPAIPWQMWRNVDDIEAIPPREIKDYPQEHWLVGPLDGPATGDRLDGFLGAARNGDTPDGIEA
jgi:hypothetical protein